MKKILFVIESLVCAGAEKSLVTLLNLIDYSQYEVDLQLFSYGGEFETMLPKEVNLLPELPYFTSTKEPIKKMIFCKKSSQEKRFFTGRVKYSIAIRKESFSNPQKAIVFWKATNGCFTTFKKKYDVAVAYAQGTPTFYVADCINADKKFAWINVTYKLSGKYREYVLDKYQKFDKICCVSDSAYEIFKEIFPEVSDKGIIIYDINDGKTMQKMSTMMSNATNDMKNGQWKVLTIGRFAAQKGYDIAVEACKILKDRGFDFVWYVLGRGVLEEEIRKLVTKKGLEDRFVMLGTRANPYPYIREADIYVQTSRFEGFGLAIAEARMLDIPVVTTKFDAVYDQMIDGENGLVVDIIPEAVADGIQRLMEDRELYNHIVEFQKTEKKGNYEEIQKVYQLLEI